jgi:hypothetical protein
LIDNIHTYFITILGYWGAIVHFRAFTEGQRSAQIRSFRGVGFMPWGFSVTLIRIMVAGTMCPAIFQGIRTCESGIIWGFFITPFLGIDSIIFELIL